MATGTRLGRWMFFGVIAVIALWFIVTLAMSWLAQYQERARPGRAFSEKMIGDTIHSVIIRKPEAVALVDSGEKDAKGQPVMVACATCHDTREPNFKAHQGEALQEFHKGLQFQHGSQTCLSCHRAEDYNSLKKADGQTLDFSQSMQLCSQCHGPQFRDYQNGSHGGMTGHWDLKQGSRERNTCTDCHDPHHPKYPLVMPVFPPKPVIGEAILPMNKSKAH